MYRLFALTLLFNFALCHFHNGISDNDSEVGMWGSGSNELIDDPFPEPLPSPGLYPVPETFSVLESFTGPEPLPSPGLYPVPETFSVLEPYPGPKPLPGLGLSPVPRPFSVFEPFPGPEPLPGLGLPPVPRPFSVLEPFPGPEPLPGLGLSPVPRPFSVLEPFPGPEPLPGLGLSPVPRPFSVFEPFPGPEPLPGLGLPPVPRPFSVFEPFPGSEPLPGPGPCLAPKSLPCPDHDGPDDNRPGETDFDKLARHVISADKQVYNSCKQSSYSRVRMLPGVDMYVLKYNLPEFAESGIKVQIKHRVISATAEAQGVATFKDLRIIPDIVKATDASWSFEKGTLTVLMPYKNPLLTEVALNCTSNINESVIDVVKTTQSEDDLRSMDEALTQKVA